MIFFLDDTLLTIVIKKTCCFEFQGKYINLCLPFHTYIYIHHYIYIYIFVYMYIWWHIWCKLLSRYFQEGLLRSQGVMPRAFSWSKAVVQELVLQRVQLNWGRVRDDDDDDDDDEFVAVVVGWLWVLLLLLSFLMLSLLLLRGWNQSCLESSFLEKGCSFYCLPRHERAKCIDMCIPVHPQTIYIWFHLYLYSPDIGCVSISVLCPLSDFFWLRFFRKRVLNNYQDRPSNTDKQRYFLEQPMMRPAKSEKPARTVTRNSPNSSTPRQMKFTTMLFLFPLASELASARPTDTCWKERKNTSLEKWKGKPVEEKPGFNRFRYICIIYIYSMYSYSLIDVDM